MGTLTITGGTLRSRRVPTPPGRAVRPTPARVKEALFSILGPRVTDARVLDLFAGTGALGFESLSRGAAHVTFVEKHRPTANALRTAAHALGVADHVDVINAPAERAATALTGRYDLVFADPPYAHAYPQPAFTALRAHRAIDPATTIVYEHSSREPAPCDPAMRVDRTERYGEVALAFMHPLDDAA
ncbi:MAG TPA: 16S rRNA (guanine(966)-N(2))-methyltransferase RsmD [Candidatus Elarobacter sp.]|jgi:16S rRNA (guanine(966)-N(2))-methyltransferase RsmD|nr:16S rRNA (guanine(966)-N(2))-methyltransferase RsmD [Candidatus Elarobacter sp.]